MGDMDDDYLIDSESEGEDIEQERHHTELVPKIVTIEDLEALKAETIDIIDPSWKISRNKPLIRKMLELDEPTISSPMVEFLVQEDACEALVGYITQIGEEGLRPSPVDPHSEELKMAYKTMMLITSDEPSEGLIDFLSKRAALVTRLILRIFEDGSAGSFFHAYRVCELFARYYPTDVFEALCSDGQVTTRMANMLRYIGYAPISELIVMIVGLSPISRTSPLYTACEPYRLEFIKLLDEWNFLTKVVEIVISPEEKCYTGAYVDAESHSLYASQLFQECVEKLSLEEIGTVLLQPIAETPELLNMLVNCVSDPKAEEYKRQHSSKILYFLLRRAADPEIMCMMNNPQGGVAQPTTVPNQLFAIRERIIEIVGLNLPVIINALATYSPSEARNSQDPRKTKIPEGPVKFGTYEVQEPFTTMRISLVELVVILIESDETMANHITASVWRLLLKWCIQYAYNNTYQSLFYRLIFAVLRQNQEQHQHRLFHEGNFLQFLMDSFLEIPFKLDSAGKVTQGEGTVYYNPPRDASQELKSLFVVRCLVMNCSHAVRLQAGSQPPNSFISHLLATSPKWNEFLPKLISATEEQHRFGMGIQVTDIKPQHNVSSLMSLMSDSEPQCDNEGGLEHGSNFAKNLGFYDECSWSEGQDGDESTYSHSSLDLSNDLESLSPDRSHGDTSRSSGEGRDIGKAPGGPASYMSPNNRSSLSNTIFFDKDNQEDSDIIDGITSPLEAMETLERRRESLGDGDSPNRNSLKEPKMSPHEIKQLFALDEEARLEAEAEALSLEKSMDDAAAADSEIKKADADKDGLEIKQADTDKEPDSESTAEEAVAEGEEGVDV
jgi:hypothetical protein